jgi:hypothetical protein
MSNLDGYRQGGVMTIPARARPERGLLRGLRTAALIAVLVGGMSSIALMLRSGRRDSSFILLVIIFAIWVLSPFTALAWAGLVSTRWPAPTRVALYVVMLLVALGSIAIYGAMAFGAVAAKRGFIFLVVPGASWLLAAAVVATAALIARPSGGGDGS